MKIVSYNTGYGTSYKVIYSDTGKCVFHSFSRVECEQYLFGMYMLRREGK